LGLTLAGASGTDKTYDVSFQLPDGDWRPLSIVAGPSQTGKTSIVEFLLYCLGEDRHPQHPEILAAVRYARSEVDLAGVRHTVERAASGTSSKFASVWAAPLSDLADAPETRLATEPPSDPLGLSQFVLSACDLDHVELPEAPTQADSAAQVLSVRDLFRVMWLPNERLDGRNLVYEQANYMVSQKFSQTIDVMFGVDDAEQTLLAVQLRNTIEAAQEAERTVASLRNVVEAEHPEGPLVLETAAREARQTSERLTAELGLLDARRADEQQAVTNLRRSLERAQGNARAAMLRVRNRESLVDRLAALREQYADEKRKLMFLREAEKLFDPLSIVTCPACLSPLDVPPSIVAGNCSLCGNVVEHPANGDDLHKTDAGDSTATRPAEVSAVLEAELRATSRRLDELNAYWQRLDEDLARLRDNQRLADNETEAAAASLDQVVRLPAPYLASRDALARQISDARLREQQAQAGLRLWRRVQAAEATAVRLQGQVVRLRAERRDATIRPDRSSLIRRFSTRFGEVLAAIGYPKLHDPMIDNRLQPHVRGLPYTDASSGGRVLISLAWYLSLWELSYEEKARAPGLLIIDSPQKNLGHAAEDPDFADARLVDNFYAHVQDWLSGPGEGAQLIVIDNSPPESVAAHVVVRYTRDRNVAPYGLIDDAVD
jgi:hypothetical protein